MYKMWPWKGRRDITIAEHHSFAKSLLNAAYTEGMDDEIIWEAENKAGDKHRHIWSYWRIFYAHLST